MNHINLAPLITSIFVGLASGYLGSFMVLRRMSLVGDALSHVALPGLALGIIFKFNPFIGAFAALFLGIIAIWAVENKTKLPTETLVGVFFTFSLAVGLLIIPDEGILDAFFGDISNIKTFDAIAAISIAIFAILVARKISKNLILSTISSDLANAEKVNVPKTDFLFLFLVALIVAVGIKIVGAILMGALVIIPAAASKNFSRRMKSFTLLSIIIGASSAAIGILTAQYLNLPPGPIVVLTGIVFFFISLLARK